MSFSPIILTGSVAIDRIMVFPGKFEDVIQPDKLHVLSVSVLLDELRETRGGVAANIAYNLGLLEQESILLAAVGQDAKKYMGDLKKLGVNIDNLHYAKNKTASFSVITDQSDCQVGGFYPGAMGESSSLSLKKWQNSAALVVISPHDPAQMAVQVEECRELGLRLFYDVGQQVSNLSESDIRAGVEAAELLILNDYELGVLEKKTSWSQAEILKKVGLMLVTLGEKGVKILQPNQEEKLVHAVKVEKVVDPTGAGDAFRAGFLFGFVRKWNLIESAQLGCVTAAFAVEKHGTQEHWFDKNKIIERHDETYAEKPRL